MAAMNDLPDPPYPNDTLFKGWRFELDLQRVMQSDTWALASPVEQAWLLKLWTVAWQQNPCGTMPPDDRLIAARLGMPLADFIASKEILLRGWWLATDGRLYHAVLTERVLEMISRKNGERDRKAAYRERKEAERQSGKQKDVPPPSDGVPELSHGTDMGLTRPSHGSDPVCDATGTGTGTGLKPKDKVKPTVEFALDQVDAVSLDVARNAEPEGDQQGLRCDDAGEDAAGCAEDPAADAAAPEDDDEPGDASQADVIQDVFAYWQRRMNTPRSKLDDKRKKTIKVALKMGYTKRDLCRAIQGCSLTPHNQGVNDRGEKYLGLHVCLKDADNIDRFMANSKAPPVAPEKKQSGSIPRWWTSDELARQQAALVGVGPAHPSEARDTWHARITAAIENGGKPVAVAAPIPAPTPGAPEAPRAERTAEQMAANSAALKAALKGGKALPASVPLQAGSFLDSALATIAGAAQ